MLASLGLDTLTEEVYLTMLSHPSQGVAEIAGLLNRTEEDVRAELDRLHELSLVRSSAQDGLRAIAPELGMEALLAQQQADLAAQQQRVEASRAAAAQLIAQFADARPAWGPHVEHLENLEQIREKLVVLTRRVRHEVMTFAPNGAHTPESLESAKPLDAELLGRGVRMRTVYLDSVRNSPHTVAYAEWLAERGGSVRTVPSLPVRMVIVDRETAVIPVRAEDARQAAVVLTGQGTLTALCALFESAWSSAVELGAVQKRDESGLSPRSVRYSSSCTRG